MDLSRYWLPLFCAIASAGFALITAQEKSAPPRNVTSKPHTVSKEAASRYLEESLFLACRSLFPGCEAGLAFLRPNPEARLPVVPGVGKEQQRQPGPWAGPLGMALPALSSSPQATNTAGSGCLEAESEAGENDPHSGHGLQRRTSFRAERFRKGSSLLHPGLKSIAQACLSFARNLLQLKMPLFLYKQLG